MQIKSMSLVAFLVLGIPAAASAVPGKVKDSASGGASSASATPTGSSAPPAAPTASGSGCPTCATKAEIDDAKRVCEEAKGKYDEAMRICGGGGKATVNPPPPIPGTSSTSKVAQPPRPPAPLVCLGTEGVDGAEPFARKVGNHCECVDPNATPTAVVGKQNTFECKVLHVRDLRAGLDVLNKRIDPTEKAAKVAGGKDEPPVKVFELRRKVESLVTSLEADDPNNEGKKYIPEYNKLWADYWLTRDALYAICGVDKSLPPERLVEGCQKWHDEMEKVRVGVKKMPLLTMGFVPQVGVLFRPLGDTAYGAGSAFQMRQRVSDGVEVVYEGRALITSSGGVPGPGVMAGGGAYVMGGSSGFKAGGGLGFDSLMSWTGGGYQGKPSSGYFHGVFAEGRVEAGSDTVAFFAGGGIGGGKSNAFFARNDLRTDTGLAGKVTLGVRINFAKLGVWELAASPPASRLLALATPSHPFVILTKRVGQLHESGVTQQLPRETDYSSQKGRSQLIDIAIIHR